MNYETSTNSGEWWYKEFITKSNWETGIKGSIQTDMFAQIAYALINPTIKDNISKILGGSFIDFGCALGQATKMLRLLNDKVEIIGAEISEEARKKAIENVNTDVKILKNIDEIEKCELIYASQVLEYYKSPKDILNQLLEKSNNYVIVLAPYELDVDKNELSGCKIEEKTLKNLIWDKPEWKLIQQTIIGPTDNFYNSTKQVLGVYKKIF